MITDDQTNFLYLADTLPKMYPDFYQNLEKVLTECSISFELLPGTKDIWSRDYMPIQLAADRFVQFVFDPDYLQSKQWQKTISDTNAICSSIGIVPTKSAIKVDGGNVVRASNKAIMCDKVFTENPQIPEKKLIKALQEHLEVERIVIIPADSSDKIGHADGMVRFLDDRTVLINDYSKEKPQFQRSFRMALHNAGLDWMEIPYNPYCNAKPIHANGVYINYLQMKEVIILPVFGMKEDEQVVRQFEQLSPASNIATVDSNDIAAQGGVLNCITWNIKKS
ncbi:agmatine deiminase family protein [Pontibacter mangrovi]|uniref:Agmatine deiminase family protein n=1 Tax=Pontibacter mangrovi TaxID=2589816 RepID=A0A501W4M3_9BACT|nr:agmatine deiminase family protein [Pontibacter mangrovi]TPE43605.1 agmatine deiminase family protein [Pontibacter mangrovi]